MSRSSRWIKRCLDVIGALVLLVLVAPLMLVVAILIRRDSPGAVFFRQQRLGMDLREFTFQPTLPLRKVQPGGQPDRYKFTVLGGSGGVTDLAGNRLPFGIDPTTFTLTQSGPNVDSGSISLKFNSNDEDGDSFPEIRGQFLYDVVQRKIRARNVSRFSQVADWVNKIHPVGGREWNAYLEEHLSLGTVFVSGRLDAANCLNVHPVAGVDLANLCLR